MSRYSFLMTLLLWAPLAGYAQTPVYRESYLRFSHVQQDLSSGIEFRWDTMEPIGFMALADGDTACVTFPPVAGGKLDSIRVALRRKGSIVGGVWRLSRNSSPLGMPLAVPVSASCADEPATPYPVPWTNWSTIRFGHLTIPVDSGFAVAFVCRGDPMLDQRLMVTEQTGTPPHSITFLGSPGGGKSGGWFVLPMQNSTDTSYCYLVRAYVTVVTGIDRQPVELMPAAIRMEQNYPNPFNGSTVLEYQLPAVSKARLSVYDMLGREVSILVNGLQPSGKYSVRWNADGVGSGIYFYRLQAGEFTQTRRLCVLR